MTNANVLCFGGVMDTYLLWKGMAVQQVGAWKSLASAMGFVGTLCYKVSTTSNLSVVATGTWSILFWFVCLSVCRLSVTLKPPQLLVLLQDGAIRREVERTAFLER